MSASQSDNWFPYLTVVNFLTLAYIVPLCFVEVGGQGGSKNPDKTVVLVWDTGVRAKYRAGYDGKYDLRVLDSAATGSVSSQRYFSFSHISEYLTVYFSLIFSDISQPSQVRQ